MPKIRRPTDGRIGNDTRRRSTKSGLWHTFGTAVVTLTLNVAAHLPSTIAADAAYQIAVDSNKGAQAAEIAPLHGRITDEKGAPVADARVEIVPMQGGRMYQARTLPDGSYAVRSVGPSGIYEISIFSTRCISRTERDSSLQVPINRNNPVARDFVLKVGCQVRIQVVDEQGHPLRDVQFFKFGPAYDRQFHQSDKKGDLTIGGLSPSPSEYRFAARHKDFAIASLSVKLDHPGAVVEKKVTLTKGVSVKGKVICSDGKPASAGWKITAEPVWWDSPARPIGEPIKADGSFVFLHIGSGPHTISLSIPQGGGASVAPVVMEGVDLANQKQSFTIRANFPSPASMGFIEGRVRYVAGHPKGGFRIDAFPINTEFGAGQSLQPYDDKIKLGPMPVGSYRIQISSTEFERTPSPTVSTGAKDFQIDLQVRGTLTVHGVVTGDRDGEVLKNLRVRAVDARTREPSNFLPNQGWQNVTDPKGRFGVNVPERGTVLIEASADGYGKGVSEPTTGVRPRGQEIRIKLPKGIRLSGTVVDEAGRPIDGATVIVFSKERRALPVAPAYLTPGIGIKTVAGRFQINDLNSGTETLRVLCPNYAPATLEDLAITGNGKQPDLSIVMKRGGTVRGHVYDELGRPAVGVHLYFQNEAVHYAPNKEVWKRFAEPVTDQSGAFEVAHLPESLVYIQRADEWTALGVVRRAVLPADGKTLSVDFGGPPNVTGRLLANGSPVADAKVLLSGENANSAAMKAYTMTDAEGRFVFRGIPPGERELYFGKSENRRENLIWVKSLRITPSGNDFGTIDHLTGTGTLTINWPNAEGVPPEDSRVSLESCDAVPFKMGGATFPMSERRENEPYVFRKLPIGKYKVTGFRPNVLRVQRVVEITGAHRDQTVTLVSPTGTATVHGTVDWPEREPSVRFGVELRSKHDQLSKTLEIKADGRFEFAGIPAGQYILLAFESAWERHEVAAFSVGDGETKSLSFTGKQLRLRRSPLGFLRIGPYAVNGIPLPGCQMTLTGPQGMVAPRYSQFGETTFESEPGTYLLTVTYPDFKSLTKQVEVKPVQKDGRWNQRDHHLNVMLAPDG